MFTERVEDMEEKVSERSAAPDRIKRENEEAISRVRKLVAEFKQVDGKSADGESPEPHPPVED